MYIRDSYEIHFYFRYDAVTVYDGLKETDNELGNFCGSDVRDHFLEYVSFFYEPLCVQHAAAFIEINV